MKNYDNLFSVGNAWIYLANEVLTKGIQRYRGNEIFTELKGITFSIEGNILYDDIIKKYGDTEKIHWMKDNFEVLHPVKELHNARSYASRLYDYCSKKNQIAWIIDKINMNKSVRSATITTFEPLSDTHYIPCIGMLDFDIEENFLNLYVYSRGLDFGNKAYGNMICIADILKLVAEKTNMDVGKITFICKSIHIYNTEYDEIKNIINSVYNYT